ncbi:unnamed protein product [Moneuplotes crassus]|uniref:Uncharacterized protein n=1 Tax=Euplotes crassus TaxID=5936 RepID=A0AAD2D8B6_EUPCR|nr:unnamed protein product [Moneuplotes crassus]
MHKIVILLAIALSLVSASGYWASTDNLLNKIQSGSNEILVLTFMDPNHSESFPQRLMENTKVEAEIDNFIIPRYDNAPLSILHTAIDVTDKRHEYLLQKLGLLTHPKTNEGPVVYISQKGVGGLSWGPTMTEKIEEVLATLQKEAKENVSR